MVNVDLVDKKLLNLIQSHFPLVEEPYLSLSKSLEIGEEEVIQRIIRLKKLNVIRQISGIFDTRRLGYTSCLVAVAYKKDKLHKGALKINCHPGVSHNYAREGSFYNLWFTIAVEPGIDLDSTVKSMIDQTQATAYRLMPTIRFFKIGVNFDMVKGKSAATHYYEPDRFGSSESNATWNKKVTLTPSDIAAIRVLQEDLSTKPRPFDEMAETLKCSPSQLFRLAKEFEDRGIMRRFSAVLHHRKAGFRFNGMGVWKVPSQDSESVGKTMASHPAVTHCYERPTFPDWEYTHFTMIHATTPEGCEEVAQEISLSTGIKDYRILYSTREYKKTRVRYFV